MEGVGVDDYAEEPAKKKARRRVRGLDVVEVSAVANLGAGEGPPRSIVLENKSDLSMDVGEEWGNLTWLLAAVVLERRDPAAVSVRPLAASATSSDRDAVAREPAQAP